MRIPSGVTDQYVYFVGVDSTDLKTRETGLSLFTVYRSRNGGTSAVMTTPTIIEISAANQPGTYALLVDEDMTIGTGNDSEEMVFDITHAGMASVTRTIELYRPKITVGNTLGVAADGDISGNVDGSVASVVGHTAQSGDSFARIGALGVGLTAVAQSSAYTATRGAYLDELAAANIPANIDTLLTKIIGTLAAGTHNPQSGDVFARIGALGAGLTALAQSSVYTASRAGYLDNLNIGGNVASSAEVVAIQNNTRIRVIVHQSMERPDTGSIAYKLHIYIYNDVGDMEAPDSLPTILAENQAGASRTVNLGTVTLESTGHYSVTYTLSSSDAIEQLIFEWTVIEGGLTRLHGAATQVVDTTAVDFTTADRTKLDTLHDTRCTEIRMSELDAANIPTDLAVIEAHVEDIGVSGAGLSNIPWNSAWDAEVESEVNDALVAIGLDHLFSVAVTGTDVVDNSVLAKIVSASATADWDDFNNTTDSLQGNSAYHLLLAAEVTNQHKNTDQLIESQRCHHSATGNVYYWDPINGNDAWDALTVDTARATFTSIHDNLVTDYNHDIIFAIPGNNTGTTITNEEFTISKNYVFLRGPGRDFQVVSITSANVITVTGDGVEVAGIVVKTHTTGTGICINIEGGDFALVRDVWCEYSRGHSIQIKDSAYSRISRVTIRDGGLSSGHGIMIDGSGIVATHHNYIWDVIIHNNGNDGIHLKGTNAYDNFIFGGDRGSNISHNAGYGINDEGTAIDTHVNGPNLSMHENALGNYSLTGTGAVAINVDEWALNSTCTEARLSELDIANLPTDVAAIPTAVQNREEMDVNSIQLAAIEGKTTQLNFTKTGEVDINVKSINDVTIVGDGSGTPFDV